MASNPRTADRYYRSLVGSWRGRFSFELTDARALRNEPASVWLRLSGYAFAQRAAGADWMSTMLAPAPGPDGFVHTTRVHRLGVTLFDSAEQFSLRGDGRTVAVRGVQRSWPAIGNGAAYEGEGEVSEDAMGVLYRLPWMGCALLQRTRITPEGLLLTQETPWSRARVLLLRQGRRADAA